jgi:hypothetical protein
MLEERGGLRRMGNNESESGEKSYFKLRAAL